jgi:WD40 repeat protein
MAGLRMLRRAFLLGSLTSCGMLRQFSTLSLLFTSFENQRVLARSPVLESPQLVPERGQLFDCSSCIFARDGKNIVTAGIDDAVLWDASTGEEIRRYHHAGSILNIAIGPGQDTLLTVGGDHLAKLWDLATGNKLQTFKKHEGMVVAGAFSEDGKSIFTASIDESMCVWSPDSPHPKRVIGGLTKIDEGAFDPKGKSLVFRSTDKKIHVLDLPLGRIMRELPVDPTDPRADSPGMTGHPVVLSGV